MSPITLPPRMSAAANYEELCEAAVQKILTLSQQCIQARGRFTMALSGGSTPKGVYSLMAGEAFRGRFDWKNIYLFLGDERWVPKDSDRSNYKMIADCLLSKVDLPVSNFHAVKTDTPDVQSSASAYEKDLTSFFALKSNQWPSFDLVLLGLGPDGHTASLFPNHPVLEENKHLTVGLEAKGIPEKRITLTLPVINHARSVFFLVHGDDKAAILKKIFEGKEGPSFPAGRVDPQGQTWWFVDKSAAALLAQ